MYSTERSCKEDGDMASEVTKWFSGYTFPEMEGIYERKYPSAPFILYSYFDGNCWRVVVNISCGAESDPIGMDISYYQCFPWRGLKKKP
jgi:hypothetical protein